MCLFNLFPDWFDLHMLWWLTFWILQALFTCKHDFIEFVFDMWYAGHYLQMIFKCQYIVCISLVRMGHWCINFFQLAEKNYVSLFTILLYLLCAPLALTYWMSLEPNSYAYLKVWYMFCRFPTSLWSLVNVQNFLHYLSGLNNFLVVIKNPINGIIWHFPAVVNLETI